MIENSEFIFDDLNENAEQMIGHLLEKQPNNAVIRFLNAKWMLKERRLDQAFEEAKKSFSMEKTEAAYKLMQLVSE